MTFGLLIIAGVATFAVFYALTPDADDLNHQAESELSATQIMWAGEEGDEGEGNVALTTGEVNRIPVEFEEIPDSVVSGVLAAEQHTFYDEPGISLTGTMRAVLSGGEAGGGSTITQQMARNYYAGLSQEQTIQRKIREIFISIKLGQQLDPDQILEQYLNTIYFGRNASGVEAAAQAYFDKPVSELDDAEGAFIGLIIQQPSAFANPTPDGPHDKVMRGERWEYLQQQLGELNKIEPDLGLPPEEANQLEFPEAVDYNPEEAGDPKLGYINNAVINEVERRYDGINGADIATKGYTIKTSLDEDLMVAAEEAFEVLPEMADDTMRGLTSVDPATGEIVAFNGGPNPVEVINNSLTHQTQAGSAYKPFVLATALRDNISLNSQFDGDSPQEFPGLQSPVQNAGDQSYGDVDLIQATADSINTPYVELMVQTGVQNVDQLAVDMGVNPARTETSLQGPLVALGTHQVNTLDMASAYATFAAQGQQRPAHMITELRNSKGEVIEPNDAEEIENGTEVLSSGVAADATHAMTQVVENGGGGNAALPDGRPVAGKTGTSSDAVSAWFVGYTPQLSTSVSLSRASAEPLQVSGQGNMEIFGGTTSAKVWSEYMAVAMEGKEVREFPPPQFVGEEQNYLPTPEPTEQPTEAPTEEPTEAPTEEPTEQPTEAPTSPEDCHWLDPNCEQEEIDCEDPQFEGHPDCQEEDPALPEDPGTDDDREGNNSLIRPNRE
ncbi:transglycosylase domain-containing protein [Nocardiopsis kunsanensis]|uniref:Carboxypeptidase n=1 Tax=Nocardiopsis kunsanensis TaxID=141693 RepID=A0A919CLS2_9ACTN|nr:carboxypeptidase [Nocardiopsis kunsanensis]